VKNLLLLLFILILQGVGGLCLDLYGQESLAFRHLDSRQGLSQNLVLSIVQDGDGFMWFGTRKGLNRYDGYRFRTFSSDSAEGTSLLKGEVRHLYFDPQIQRLWIAVGTGLSRYCPRTERFKNFFFHAGRRPGAEAPEVVHAVLRDSRGQVWVGTEGGLYRFDEPADTFLWCARPSALPPSQAFNIWALLEDGEGNIWIGSEAGLFGMRPDAEGAPAYLPRPEDPATRAMAEAPIQTMTLDGEGHLWLGTYKAGLYIWRPGESPRHMVHDPQNPFSLSDNDVRVLQVDPRGRVWVGSFLGINVYEAATDRFFRYQHEVSNPRSLSSGSVRSICFDSRGSAWVGTYYGGISYHHADSYRFTHHQPGADADELSHRVISAFWEDEQGNMWVGTEGGGLNYWDRGSGTYTHYQHVSGQRGGLSGNNIKALAGRGDSLWIGTFAGGLNLYRPSLGRWQHWRAETGLGHDNVYGLLLDTSRLWIATYRGGLSVMDLQYGRIQTYRHDPADSLSLSDDHCRIVFKDVRDRYWVGTSSSLDRIERLPSGQLRFHRVLEGDMVCSLLSTSDGRLWVGTYESGLLVLDPSDKVVRRLTLAEGLPGHTVVGLLQDRSGRIWISTDRGVARYDPRDASLTSYNHSDGLSNLEYNFHACYRTRSEEMFFGGTQGFTSFFPDAIRTNTFVPPVVFSHFKSANQLVRPAEANSLLEVGINEARQLTLPYNRATFSLGFAALDYLNPENNHYAYQLEGLDEDWTYVQGQAEVTYTLQQAGTYTFRLRGGNNDGIWNHEERMLEVKVLPPPWRSPLAYSLYALLGLILVGGAFRFVQIRHRLQLEQLTMVKQEELHQAKLRFYTNITHEFRTPLTLILGPTEDLLRRGPDAPFSQQKLQAIRQNTQRLLRLVNQLLNFRSLEHDHSALQVASGNLVPFLREVHAAFQEQARMAQIEYRFEAEAERFELWFDRDKLEKVFVNLLSNAFKFTPAGGQIILRIADGDAALRVEVCDSGTGVPEAAREHLFERFYHLEAPDHAPQPGTGIGLALCKELVELHGGRIELVESSGPGACFRVSLPKGKAHFAVEHLLPEGADSEDVKAYLAKAAKTPAEASPLADMASHSPRKTLLLVEDNAQVRTYVKGIFEAYFEVLEAENGEIGLKTAQAVIPDLVISDVMMPVMDGISLCSELKRAVETSHIPVILLTARTGQPFRVEGLEIGADAYLTKPFSPYELQLKVRNLFEARQRIWDRFHGVLKLEPSEVTLTSADEAFLTKAIAVVETFMGDPDFTVEVFAREMAISRPLIFTKLKAITNQTPNNFVKALRMKRSAQLLRQSDLGVAEIAYEVGFRDARYFSKCFQKEYEQTPSEYRTRVEV